MCIHYTILARYMVRYELICMPVRHGTNQYSTVEYNIGPYQNNPYANILRFITSVFRCTQASKLWFQVVIDRTRSTSASTYMSTSCVIKDAWNQTQNVASIRENILFICPVTSVGERKLNKSSVSTNENEQRL